MKSMTGYGKAEYQNDKVTLSVEIKTVNNRFLDISYKYPRSFTPLQESMRSAIQKHLSRGKVDLYVNYKRSLNGQGSISFDESLLTSLKTIDPNVQCWLLGNLTEANMNKCVTDGFTGISVPYDDISEILLQQAHTLGLEVAAYVVDVNANNQTLKNILCDYTTMDSMDYYSTLDSSVVKNVNGFKLYSEKDLRYAESGEFHSGILSGFIKRANVPGITSGTDINSCFSPNTTTRVYSTRVLPIKQNSTVSYVCDAASKFAVVSFDADGKFLGDLGWTQNGAGSGTYTESRNAGFAFLLFANSDDSTVTDKDMERFARIVKRVTI